MSLKPRYRLTLAYDGTDFFGWQKQNKPDQPSIQSELEEALGKIFNEKIQVIGSGRTDRGVHAKAQVCHFNSPLRLMSSFDLPYKLNELTAPGICVHRIQTCPPRFHAQLWAKKKTYDYFIDPRKRPDAFNLRYSWHYPYRLDLEELNKMAELITGKMDFKSFQSKGTPTPTTVRTILNCKWEELEDGRLRFRIEGDGFLKQMVRNIVGTMIGFQKDEIAPEKITEVIEAQDRQKAGGTAPGHGLFMDHVDYGPDTDGLCKEF